MTTQKLFLVRAEVGQSGRVRECVMRLPVDKYGGVTFKGRKIIAKRFLDGTTGLAGSLKYALCLEQFSNAEDLIHALERYQRNIL